MAKRGENIRKRKDGRWEGRVTLQLPDGGRKVHSYYGRTYQEVKEKVICARAHGGGPAEEGGSRAPLPPEGPGRACPPWDSIAQEWLEGVRKKRKHSTYVKYRNIYRCYIREYLACPLLQGGTGQAGAEDILERYDTYSDSIKKSILLVLRNIFFYGAKEYKAEAPDIRVDFGKGEKKNKVQVLSETEQNRLWQYLTRNPDGKRLPILICLTTGLRLGEICALKWADIDFTGGILNVNSTVQRISSEGCPGETILLETEPKTFCSKREIPLPEMLLNFLKCHSGKGIYVTGKGTPMEPRTCQNIWKRCQEEADISYKNFHVLRHTFATNCIRQGMDVKSLSEILGHSDVKTTLNRYVHPSMETKRAHINSVYFYFINADIVPAGSVKGSESGVR